MNDSDSSYPSIKKAASLLPSFNFGNGLVEIAALTTLIGSSTAGDLILGNRGAAGIVWGTITAFGTSSVIKACASAASPGWLRQMLGLRTMSSDKAVGMNLSLAPTSRVSQRVRGMLENAIGVSCSSDDPDQMSIEKLPKLKEHNTYCDIYAFDRSTSIMLEELSATLHGEALTVYTHHQVKLFPPHKLFFQTTALLLSLLKAIEIYVFLKHGGLVIGLLSGIPFAFSFGVGLWVEVMDFIASRRPLEVDGHFDLISGVLPTTKQPGGPRKIVLGATNNTRTRSWWRIFWVITGILQTFSIVMSYLLLGQQQTVFVLMWAAFQLGWMVLRILLFHLTDASHPMANRPMSGRRLEALPLSMKLRVANLVCAVSLYQAHLHPRGLVAYLEDSFSTRQIARLASPSNITHVYPLPLDSAGLSIDTKSTASEKMGSNAIRLNILAVIGDTTLSSAAWIIGDQKYSPMDLYDSCIIIFEVPSFEEKLSKALAIPAARVYSGRFTWSGTVTQDAEESLEPLFVSRGTGSQVNVEEQTWIYWIPCETGDWLQFKCRGAVLGRQTGEVLTETQLDRILGAGNLNISLKDVADVKSIVGTSREAAKNLLEFLH